MSATIKSFKKILKNMTIYGIGTDIVSTERIKKLLNNKNLLHEFSIKKKSLNVKE